MPLQLPVNSTLSRLAAFRTSTQRRMMQAGLPALFVATELPDVARCIGAAEYTLKSSWWECLTDDVALCIRAARYGHKPSWWECLTSGSTSALLAEAEHRAKALWD
jgi:hypothetical protein